jgi:CRP-like cAMP-binding protein
VRKGKLEESYDGVHTAYLGAGSVVNMKGLMYPHQNAGASLHTVTHCEVFVLRRRDVLKVAQMFPKFAAILATRL